MLGYWNITLKRQVVTYLQVVATRWDMVAICLGMVVTSWDMKATY